jgi:hypothetical protein
MRMNSSPDTWPRRLVLGSLAAACAAPARLLAMEGRSEVFVVSTLYARHKQAPIYGLPVLRRVLDAVRPDVLVLDVTPTELRTRKVWPGKVEYSELIFPHLDATGVVAYGSEPDEALFKQLTGSAGQSYKAFNEGNPQGAKALEALKGATYQALASTWASAADVNSDRTDRLVAALREIEEGLVGENAARVQAAWDRHHADRVLDAVRAHPAKRVLMLVGIESRYRVVRALQSADGIVLVRMEQWLRDAGL